MNGFQKDEALHSQSFSSSVSAGALGEQGLDFKQNEGSLLVLIFRMKKDRGEQYGRRT
jgi:hypothetical protein